MPASHPFVATASLSEFPVLGERASRSPGGFARLRRAARALSPRRRLAIGWSLYVVALALYVGFLGVPYSEDDLLVWLAAALFVVSLSEPRSVRRGILLDWLPLYGVLAAFELERGYASHLLWGPFIRPQVAFDSYLGGGVPLTVRLQHWLFNPHDLRPWDYAAWAVYMSHFFTSFTVAAVLWKRDHPRFRRFILLFVGLTFLGYTIYVLYPAMPPWLASQTGNLASTTRIIPVVWDSVGIRGAAALFTGGSKFDNNVAAMPSMHAAYPMFLLLFFWGRARAGTRVLLVTYTLAMAFTLVYTGEHFIIDELVGWSLAIGTFVFGSRLLDRWGASGRFPWLLDTRAPHPSALATLHEVGKPEAVAAEVSAF